VVTISSLGERTINSEHSTLRRVLKRADYATSDMQAAEGPDYHDEVVVIRRIEAGSISLKGYPASITRQKRADPDALASWENEGGATGAAWEIPNGNVDPQ
jgi:hypothetical protein